jgi:twitching motility protein PilJ
MATNVIAIKRGAQPDEQEAVAPPQASSPERSPEERSPRAGVLPLIGHHPVGKQLQILLGLLVFFLLVATLCVFLNARQAARDTLYLSTATEMQMLSQRIANSAQQAVQGQAAAFGDLKLGHDRFVEDLKLLTSGGTRLGASAGPSPGAIQPQLQALARQWEPVQKDIALILAQEKNLIELRRREATIERTAPQLSLQALDLMVNARDAGERYRVTTAAHQLYMDVGNFDFINAVRLLSTETPNPQVALQLGNNTRGYLRTLKGLLGEEKGAGITPVADADVKQSARALDKSFAPFAASVHAILENMTALSQAKQASRDIFAASEGLLKSPVELAAFYHEGRAAGYLAWAAGLCALLALGSLVLLGKVYVDDSRRRAEESRLRAEESEQQNKANQAGILRLLDEISNLANGDLTARARVTEDITGAIADSINYTIDELRRLVTGITGAAEQVRSATQEASTISGQLLQAAQKQAAEIQGTGRSVSQMAQSMNDVSKSAGASAKVAETSLHAAEKGAQAVQNAIRGMNEIRDQIQETSKRIKRLGESSQEIGEIVQLISDITEQTNVLALNAAIQAASAGEAGRGFTVVAEEVQRLAERSAEATKHISAIVKSIQRDTQDAVEAMERSTQGVIEGTRTADQAGQALREIEQVSNRLAELIASISDATQRQAESATRVAANMKQILGITQLTTDGTRKTAGSAERLTTLAEDLKKSVAGFKLP